MDRSCPECGFVVSYDVPTTNVDYLKSTICSRCRRRLNDERFEELIRKGNYGNKHRLKKKPVGRNRAGQGRTQGEKRNGEASR